MKKASEKGLKKKKNNIFYVYTNILHITPTLVYATRYDEI